MSFSYQEFNSIQEIKSLLSQGCELEQDAIASIKDFGKLKDEIIYNLQFNASINENLEIKQASIFWINKIADALDIQTDSNAAFYDEKAAEKHEFFTVPAINSRMMTFHTVRSAARTAQSLGLPHIIYELALSEMGYTAQQKDEYVALVKAAHISLGLKSTKLYIQADHYQIDPKKYAADSNQEMQRIQGSIIKAIESGVYNIDLDCSKFETADADKTDKENQSENARFTAELLHFIRQYEKQHKLPCIISVGGEVGEVGGENTKYPQVNAYLELVNDNLKKLGSKNVKGLSKVSINVGSSHGGVLGPDGKPLDNIPIDFKAHHDVYIKGVDQMNKNKHVLSVQHGASTLPDKYFVIFPAMHVAEIHLATGFQNIVWDVLEKSDKKLFEKMKQVAFEKFSDKIKKHETEAVGFMKERKAVTQFVKKDLLLTPAVQKIEKAIEQECTKLFYSLFSIFVSKKGNIDSGDRAD